jgi:hypothetical protein
MTGILDRIREMTPESIAKAGSSFEDDKPYVYRARVEREMIREVKGADDMRHPRAGMPNAFAGQVTVDPALQRQETRPFKGQPTEGQRRYMNSLMLDLVDLDFATWEAGQQYMIDMDANEAWDASRGGNASRWIDRLKAKIAELKAAVPAPVAAPARTFDKFEDIPSGYYAYAGDEGPDDIKFFRVTHKDGTGQYEGRHFVNVYACASDERHQIKVWSTRQAILNKIRAIGPAEAMALYGQKLGHCGRCHRELTDAVSRARGIGPDCWGKM